MGGVPCSFTQECNTIGESTFQPCAVRFFFSTSVFFAFTMGPYGIPKSVCLPVMDGGSGYQGGETFLTAAATPACFHLSVVQMKHVASKIMMDIRPDLSKLVSYPGGCNRNV